MGKLIAKARDALGYTQEGLAWFVGVSEARIVRGWEKGHHVPASREQIWRLCFFIAWAHMTDEEREALPDIAKRMAPPERPPGS